MAACLAWHSPAVTAMTHMTHVWAEKKSEVTFSRRQMARYMEKNHRSPLTPSRMRPMREYCLVMRASCPSALSKELAHTSRMMPMTLTHRSLK